MPPERLPIPPPSALIEKTLIFEEMEEIIVAFKEANKHGKEMTNKTFRRIVHMIGIFVMWGFREIQPEAIPAPQ